MRAEGIADALTGNARELAVLEALYSHFTVVLSRNAECSHAGPRASPLAARGRFGERWHGSLAGVLTRLL
jgi:hypothetical protein